MCETQPDQKSDTKVDMEEGLFINGERCRKDTLYQCSPNGGNILVTYDTSPPRSRSPETISSSDSDVIILANGEKVPPWTNSKEVEFTRGLSSLRTPSPRELVVQWLQASPAYKTPGKTQTILKRSVDERDPSKSKTTAMFEIFDLGASRLNKMSPAENPSGSRTSLTPMSPETRRKQELCSYLQLMNMTSKSEKQRTKIRSSFNRRSNRVKNLIVQIEKRKREAKINKELKPNSLENSEPSISILQGFTPCLMPIEVRKRKVAFDIIMRRYITDEGLIVKRTKGRYYVNPACRRTDVTSEKQGLKENYADGQSFISLSKPDLKVDKSQKNRSVFADDARSLKTTKSKTKPDKENTKKITPDKSEKPIKRKFTIIADDVGSEISARTRLKNAKLNNKDNKQNPNKAIRKMNTSEIVQPKKLKALKCKKSHRKMLHKLVSVRDLTLFEKEILKISRLRANSRSRLHNLRIRKNRLKHKENLPNKISKKDKELSAIVKNVLKSKQGRSNEYRNNDVHKNNGAHNGAKFKLESKTLSEMETKSSLPQTKEGIIEDKKGGSLLHLFTEKEVEIVDLSVKSLEVTVKEVCQRTSQVEDQNGSQKQTKTVERKLSSFEPNDNLVNKRSNALLIEELHTEFGDHDYAKTDQKTHKIVPNEIEDFRGFTAEEQCLSDRMLKLISCMELAINTVPEDNDNSNNEIETGWNKKIISKSTTNECPIEENHVTVIHEELHLENRVVSTESLKNSVNTEEPELIDELIHYNMHDYYVPERLDKFSDLSDDNSSTNDEDSSDKSSIYSEPAKMSSHKQNQEASAIERTNTKPIAIIVSKVTETDIEPFRPVTPPTYIPFLSQTQTPSRTLHRNLTNNNNCIRRKVPLLNHQSSTSSMSKAPPSDNPSNHCASLAPENGRLLHAEYCAGQLVASQERLVTCWAQTPLGHILHSQELWIARGAVARQHFGEDSVLKDMKNRLMIVDNVVSYVEIWVKEHRSVFRERPVGDVFAVIYSWKPNQLVEKKLIQLENIKGPADDVQCIILKKSRSVLVSWSIMQSTIKQATVLQLYQLSPDYQRVLTVKELKSIGTKIQSLHMIEDRDDLVIGCGENCVNIWNIEYGYIVATLDMPDTLPEPKCLWTLSNHGFVFLLQECNDGLLRLIAINGMKMKITWKNLKIFSPPKEYYNLLSVCLENGILIACYDNGILSWNVQSSELLTEEPLPSVETTPFSPTCFLSDSHFVQLERNGQIHVRHVLYHLLTSSDLSM